LNNSDKYFKSLLCDQPLNGLPPAINLLNLTLPILPVGKVFVEPSGATGFSVEPDEEAFFCKLKAKVGMEAMADFLESLGGLYFLT